MPNLNVMRGGNKGANRSRLRDKTTQFAQRQRDFETRQKRRAELLSNRKRQSDTE